ncbi:hypothetical protein PN492_16475 [Dolichospermum circinale CS-537/01]|uniref:Uncharacterized protein n=1 Tax=Dolichospermum circinale CS-537/01 TaxID=3021739 RepID=A0ABT5A835_9CYAN|nr:hypothetical protein [Dolichospermum circinale CS-537/01]
MKFLQCNKDTLFSILKVLAEQANFLKINTETMLALLEKIENNLKLLSYTQKFLQQQTKTSDDDT